jgi:hypothetical protein
VTLKRDLAQTLRQVLQLDDPASAWFPRVVLVRDVDKLLGRDVGRTYCLRTAVAAVAAQYQAISLLRPAGLVGVDVEIIQIVWQSFTNSPVFFGVGTSVTYTDRGPGVTLDYRDQTAGYYSGARLVDESSAAALLVSQGEHRNSGAAGVWDCSIFLDAGRLFTLRTESVNQGIRAMFVWRETPLVEKT